MPRKRSWPFFLLFAFLLFACVLEEDLRINSDGSGTYRVKLTVPKSLAAGLGDMRKEATEKGYQLIAEGDTEDAHYVIVQKEFTSVSSLNDQHDHYELAIRDIGFLRREYNLKCTIHSDVFTAFKRQLTITMPTAITSATAGERHGNQVSWDCSNGGSLEIVSAGLILPLNGTQTELFIALFVIAAGLILFRTALRMRARPEPVVVCQTCHKDLPAAARFCDVCGAVASTS